MRSIFQALTLAHWPSRCVMCGAWPTPKGTHPWCEACDQMWATTQPRCVRCARRLQPPAQECGECLRHPTHLSRCWAAVDYAFPWPSLLYQLKGANGSALGPPLARLMANAWQRPSSNPKSFEAARILWAPVPLHPRRLMERGHNQSWALLRGLMTQGVCMPNDVVLPDLIERPTPKITQHNLGREARKINSQFAFQVSAHQRSRVSRWLLSEPTLQVVLIDDVYTTGATLDAAARALTAVWPVPVNAMVFARTPAR